MAYYLLTGATGLLGSYLMRDLLTADAQLAVLVRSSRRQSAQQRVEACLADWERRLGRSLPRPVVLEGDLTEPDLGLDGASLRWASEYCDAVIHNAASLTFHATSSAGEPYRSNVNGTKHVLDLCRSTGIREFHHVSTAYVAGLRKGRAFEHELDEGQELSNDYEKSKVEAEQLVRAADFLDPVTVHRPGIIIGDSETGFTTTYHGFYAALQLACKLADITPPNFTGLRGGHPVRLALDGTETKHLVPVDWVSAVMSHVIRHPEHHGKTYHLTPRHPVSTRTIRDVLEVVGQFYGARLVGRNNRPENMSEVESLFYDHIRVYDSYWRHDPEFDRTNVEAAAPHLPCPHVGLELLLKLSHIVRQENFPSPAKHVPTPACDLPTLLGPWLEAGSSGADETVDERLLGLDVHGAGGGQWQLVVRGDRLAAAEDGLHPNRHATFRSTNESLAEVVAGRRTVKSLLASGEATLIGNGRSHDEYVGWLDRLLIPANEPVAK